MRGDAPLTPVDFDPFADAEAPAVLPLTEPQREMWAAVQMGDEASCAYNQCHSLTLRGPLSVDSMQSALRQVMDRHDALRVSIDADGERQRISASSQIALPVIDLSRQSPQSRAAEVARVLQTETEQPFDLAAGPLLRARLIREDADLHRLILTVHHIVCDGWSAAVLLGDLGRIYAADRHGLRAQLPFASPYRDYVVREARRAHDAQARADEDYWAQQYADSIPVLELPLERSRPGTKTYHGACQKLRLDEFLYRDLKKAGAQHGCTLFVTLLAGFEALISRLSGQQDFAVGVPMAGQALLDNGHLVGHCINMVPVRCRIEPAMRFVDHLKSVRHTLLEAQSHQLLTFGSLVRRLSVPRNPGRTPLVSATFNIDKIGAPLDFGDLVLESVEGAPKRFVNFEIAINAVDSGRDLTLECEYNTDLFTSATIGRWLGHYRVLLEAIASDAGQRTNELPLLTGPERHQLLVEWNDAGADYPADALFHQLFEAQVQRVPKRTALTVGTERLSYAKLDTRATRIAQALHSRGVGRGDRVGLCVERGADMLAAVLGILKAGAAYVPLDPSFPEERLRFMADDAQLALLVSTTALAGSFGLPRERQLLLDADARSIASAPYTCLPVAACAAQPEDPAYVIYTSGSTGKPKGVVVPHRAVVNFLTSMAREPGLTPADVLVAVTTLSFDIAVLELQLPLTLGARVVIATHDEAIDGRALGALLERHRATVMQATPSTWRLLLEAGWTGRPPFKALVGGEALPEDLADQLLARGVELWNMYGPTETTVWSTCARISDTSNGITIGKPIANTTARILDAQKNLCPIGVPGELCIGGDGVALGYWNRPELTADRFIPDPFSAGAGATLYRTGDRACWRNDGTLEHLGRLDFQVKLRGFRVEVGEVEAGITRHPAVREIVVVAREDTPGDKRLVAYVVTENAPADLADQLRALIRATMPEYMVPAHFVMLEALPLTLNGKLDRKALPPPGVGDATPRGAMVAPRTPTEEMVMDAFHEVLDRADFGALDNFFDLGGHSLMAARIMSRLRAASGRDLPLRVLFERQTVSALAEAIDALEWLASARQQPAVTGNRVEIEL
jgi:amino acid adenylation domain-containing protein